jgi:hypothetical protein
VTGRGDVSRETSGPWITYLNQEHAAREMYLLVVERAHREYLAGPWPDRGSYEVVERQAWNTYYAAGRGAWGRYQAALETPPPPPRTAVGYEPNFPPDYRVPDYRLVPPPPPASHPYPLPARGNENDEIRHGQATFTRNPGNGQPDQSGERQENYLAADPDTRDGH